MSDATANSTQSEAYERNPLGNLLARDTDSTDWAYGYDATDQLTNALALGVSAPSREFSYTYDPMGNLTRRVTPSNDGGSSATNTYDPNYLNQYSAISNQQSQIALSYDLNGNLTNDGARAYTWNIENRLANVEPLSPTNGAHKIENAYDYMGRRVKKVTSEYSGSTWSVSATNLYFYDGWNLVRSTTMSNDVVISTNHYTWGQDLSGSFQGAGGIGGLLTATFGGSNTVYYCYDHNGNVTKLINESGATVAEYEYDPFGRIIKAEESTTLSASGGNPFRFSTKYHDDEIYPSSGGRGLVYYGYRFYDPELGRWPSRDPIGEWGGRNLYAFVRNGTLGGIDVLGLFTKEDAKRSLRIRRFLPESLLGGYTQEQVFDEWLRLEQANKGFWKALPKCPRRICIDEKNRPENPDPTKWANPAKMNPVTRHFHPNGVFEMRTKATGRGNQCIYDKDGVIMRNIPSAGTADLYSPNGGGFTQHQEHDVKTFNLAKKLGRIRDYYSVREIWTEQ